MDHSELVQEMLLLEKMTAQERLKHARRRRQQQLKNWMQRDGTQSNGASIATSVSNGTVNGKSLKSHPLPTKKTSVKFPQNVVLLEGNVIRYDC